jgi:hypothetical protein
MPCEAFMRLTLHTVPASQGLRWLGRGWGVFRRAPLAFSALLALYLVAVMVATLIPVIGPIAAVGTLPLLSLVYMLHSHQSLQQRPLGWSLWAQPFKLSAARTRSQLALGGLFVLGMLGVMVMSHWVDGGAMQRLQEVLGDIPPDANDAAEQAEAAMVAALQDSDFLQGVAMRTFGTLLLAIPFWYAPALVHWGGQTAMQSLFCSVLGLWRNRGAFLLNGLAWVGVLIAGSSVLAVISAVTGSPALMQMLVMPATLFMGSVFYAGLYFMFVDSFRFMADPSEPNPVE